jgi:uncharacterized membrane protein YtjA (UPF0391 family)
LIEKLRHGLQAANVTSAINAKNPLPASWRAEPLLFIVCFGTKQAIRGLFAAKGTQLMSLLKWALIFLVVSIIAAVFGFTGISAASADIARILFYIFVIIFVVLLVLGVVAARRI